MQEYPNSLRERGAVRQLDLGPTTAAQQLDGVDAGIPAEKPPV